jgi:hypothetical protein
MQTEYHMHTKLQLTLVILYVLFAIVLEGLAVDTFFAWNVIADVTLASFRNVHDPHGDTKRGKSDDHKPANPVG